ncbi:MAG: Fe-S cluster assembly sulfur transfer protein SufU [Alphaproteobacteria bacterium]
MDDELRELYQEVILDHSRHPRNFGHPPEATCEARGHNPLCGDRMTLYLTVEDAVVRDARFEGNGCAISMASASLMTEAIKGMPVDEARALFARFHDLVTSDGDADEALDKLTVFAGVREFPVRVKCATLAWHTLSAALDGKSGEISTED